MPRREDPRLLRGEAGFTDDLTPEGCLYLDILRSPYGAGQITELDLSGVQDVALTLTAADLAGIGAASVNALLPGGDLRPMVVLADGRVAAVGQGVAAVVAETRAEARDALEAILFEVEEEAQPPEPVLHHVWQSAQDLRPTGRAVSVTLDHALVAPMALEPRAALAIPQGSGLHLYLSTQTPQRCRDDLCAMLGLPRDAVRVTARDVGGAFGGKASLMPEDVLVAIAALRLGRPVKWTATRGEEFQAATQGRGAQTRATLHLDAAGAPVAMEAELDFPLGHWMPYSALAPVRNAGRILPGPYAVPRVRVQAVASLTDGPAVNIYRGAGRPEAAMLMERLIDRAAADCGVDPLDYRLAHLAHPGPLPTGDAVCSGDYAGLLTAVAEAAGYAGLRAAQAARRAAGQVCGIGLALYVEPCGQGWETAALALDDDGGLVARSGSSAQGQGRETALAQVVADALDCDPARVTVLHSDSAEVPEGIGALASRSTAIGATAMIQAAGDLAAQAVRMVARMQNCDPAEVSPAKDGFAISGGGRVGWPALAAWLAARGERLGVSTRHVAQAEAWASGAVLAEVAIDPDTGAITVERITWVDDAGRVVNPVLVEGQMIGGLAQGLGAALMEQVVYQDGQLLTGSLMDYAVPRASDMPPVRMISRPVPSPANAPGFKGVGEAGCIGVPAALSNAVQDALLPFGADDLSLPLTSEKVWRAMTRTA
jgi:carbon-monoxide dehydrogenase large subunit